MAVTSTRSPPTASTSSASTGRVVTTWILSCARAGARPGGPPQDAASDRANSAIFVVRCMSFLLLVRSERVRPVRTQRERRLEDQSIERFSDLGILALVGQTQLAELG